MGSPRGVSNVMLSEECQITLGEGLLAVVHLRQDHPDRKVYRLCARSFVLFDLYSVLEFECLQHLLLLPLSPAVDQQPTATNEEPQTLTVMTHDSFAVSAEVITAFEQENNATVRFITSGDAGTALNRAILSRDNPIADVFYGVDNNFLSRALEEDIFEPYASPMLAEIPDEFKLDALNRALPVDYGDVCLNYDIAYFHEHNLQPPDHPGRFALPEYRGLIGG